jgi:hypothetical protein
MMPLAPVPLTILGLVPYRPIHSRPSCTQQETPMLATISYSAA